MHDYTTVPLKRYYEAPDGENCLPKTLKVAKNMWFYSSMWSVLEMAGRSQPSTLPAIAGRYVYWVAPATIMGAVYASSACLAGSMRDKDDGWNHMFGGAMAGSIVGAKYGMRAGYGSAFLFALAAGYAKVMLSHPDVNFLGDPPRKEFTHPLQPKHIGPRHVVKAPDHF